MENVIVISPRVISRMKNMSVEERRVILDTFINDEILGVERSTKLSPVQELVYMMFRKNVLSESRHYEKRDIQTLVS
ncbi:MAG: hypothetical protein MJZ74_01490 [Muribaculaceae bacterium]|nr:hypothetical protein [Muribaculaceae bacterium]